MHDMIFERQSLDRYDHFQFPVRLQRHVWRVLIGCVGSGTQNVHRRFHQRDLGVADMVRNVLCL